MTRPLDIVGKNFGKLTVLERVFVCQGKYSQWKCLCDCGNITIQRGSKLVSGVRLSCGCSLLKHGCSSKGTRPEYNSWRSMMRRCYDPSYKDFKNWGGRGITVCNEWKDVKTFIIDMGNKPSPIHTIDRIDNSKGYYKGNCRWATPLEQASNKRKRQYGALSGRINQ